MVEKLRQYFERLAKDQPQVVHWQHGVEACDAWINMQKSRPTLAQVCELDAKLESEENPGSGWLDLKLGFRRWARENGFVTYEMLNAKHKPKVSLDVGPGWLPLLDKLLDDIKGALQDAPFTILQIKQKFRGLRFYYTGGNEAVHRLIEDAQRASYRTCEECGKVAGDDEAFAREKRAWLSTLCEECWGKQNVE